MATSNIQWAAPKQISFDGNVSENYRKFEEHWNLFEKTELKGKSEEEKCSYFLLCVGEKGREIHKTLSFTTPETGTDADGHTVWKRTAKELKLAFKTYCNPRRSITYERHKFNTRNQEEDEAIDNYVTVLRTLAAACEFSTLEDSLIRDRIVYGVRSQTLKERLVRETELTLEKAINICKATEASKEQIRSLGDGKPNNIDALKKKSFKKTWKSKSDRDRTQESKHERNFKRKSDKNCGNCGRKHPPKACFAYGKRCNRCQKLGHFQSYCRSKPVEELYYENSDSENSSEHGIDMVGSREPQTNTHEEHATIRINNKPLTVKLDSGAETNIIRKEEFHRLVPKRRRKQKLKESTAKLTAFGGHDIPVIGKCHLQCRHRGTTHVLEFQVVEQGKSLLGCASCKSMELITFHNVDHLNGQKAEQSADKNTCKIAGLNSDQIFETYSSCFEGRGSISEPYRIKIDDTVNPVIHPPRKLPAALRERVKDKLHAMESQGVIKKVTQPTPWVNSMVVNEKRTGDLRICINPRDLNKAIKREHYQLPTQQEIIGRLAGAKYFSKLDAKSGFWQLQLDDESSHLTTFNTPFGRYRFTVFPFGVVFAQEVFHRPIHEKFNDIEGCETDIDDILVWGRTIEEHDQRLEQVLDRAKKIGLTLSADKCEFRRKEITYLGETLTQDGLRPDENKVKAIKDYARPESKQDVQRLFGMVNFIAKFAPSEN